MCLKSLNMPFLASAFFLNLFLLLPFNTWENHSKVTANVSVESDSFCNTFGNVLSQLIQQSCEMCIVYSRLIGGVLLFLFPFIEIRAMKTYHPWLP